MNRSLHIAAVVICSMLPLPAADKPKAKVDYQKVADDAVWQTPTETVDYCLAHEASGYQLVVTRKKGISSDLTIRVFRGKEELYTFAGHTQTVFFERDDVLYHTAYLPSSSGCTVIAFDLKKKKEVWSTRLKAIPLRDHSKYRNEVRVDMHGAGVMTVFGNETYGKYVEILDLKTGETVGHKVFPEQKK